MSNYLIFGSQGSGKSTFAPNIAQKLAVAYLATGELFRTEIEKDSAIGKLVSERIKKGIYIDDATTWQVLVSHLEKATNGFLLDGYPRNLKQVATLEKNGYQFAKIFSMTMAEKVAIKRLQERGRADDTQEGIKSRLDLYKKLTLPVLNFYKKQGVEIVTFDNTPEKEVVREKINDYFKN